MKNHVISGRKVWLPELGKIGTALKTDANGNITSVNIDGDIVDTANKIVQLWDLLSWFYRLIISLFLKKK